MDIHLSVETSCWRQCFKRTFERYSSLDGPSSGSIGLGNSPGRSAMTLYHEPGSSSGVKNDLVSCLCQGFLQQKTTRHVLWCGRIKASRCLQRLGLRNR